MANPFLDAYYSEFGQEDEEEKKKRQQEQKIETKTEESNKNIFLDSYYKQFPAKKATVEEPEVQPVQETQQQKPVQQPKQNFFQKIGQKVSQTIRDIRGITPEILGEELSKAPQRLQEQVIEPITNPVDTYNSFLNKGLAKNLEQKYKDIQDEKAKDAPNQKKLSKLENQVREIEQALDLPSQDLKSVGQKYKVGAKYEFGYDTRGAIATLTTLAANTLDFVTKLGENDPAFTALRERADKLEETDPEQAKKIREMFALDEKPTTRKVSENMKKWAADIAPDTPDQMDKLKDGLVSTVPFLVASVLSGGSASIVALKMSMLEAAGEAGAVYEENRSKGESIKEASKKADGNFISNLIIGYFTNKVTFFSDEAKLLKRSANSMTSEAAQEASQQFSSNYFTGKEGDDLWEGVLESGKIGGFSGGVLSFVLGGLGVSIDTTTGERLAGLQESAAAELTGGVGEVPAGVAEEPEGGAREEPEEADIGITSFRGTPVKTVEETQPYFETTRAKGFEKSLTNESQDFDVQVDSVSRTAGVWEGNIEPSFSVKLTATESNYLAYAAEHGIKANQDAVVIFKPVETGTGSKYVISGVESVDTVLSQLAESGVQGATVQDGKIVVFDSDGSLKSGIMSVVEGNNYVYEETKGNVRFLEKSEYQTYARAERIGGNRVPSKLQTQEKVTPKKLTKREQLRERIKQRAGARTVKFRETTVTPQNFKQVIEENTGEAEIRYINTNTDDFRAAQEDVKNGVKTMSNLPILVREGVDGRDIVVDGNHRLAEAIARGDTKIRVITDETLYRQLSEIEEQLSDRSVRGKGGRFAGSISIQEKVKQYVSERGTKFRTGEEDLVLSKFNPRQMTTKFLEHPDIRGKGVLSKTYIRNLSNSKGVGLKAYEYNVIQDVLDRDFANQDKISGVEFRNAVLKQMMPLDVIPSDTYASYGLDNIGRDNYAGDFREGAKTFILNSPFDHGQTGHFSPDFSGIEAARVEIREIPVNEQNKTPKFAVIRSGVELNEENIQENVLTVTNTREEAQNWIDKNVVESGETKTKFVQRPKGLFAHFRSFADSADTSFVVEIQSDSFQRGVGVENRRKELQALIEEEKLTIKGKEEVEGMSEYAKAQLERSQIRLQALEKQLEELPELPKEERVFNTYKNIWQERVVREAINMKALDGFKKLRFPTPRTVAVIEGFTGGENGDIMPYDIVSANDPENLAVGDTIDYGGTEYTILESDPYNITVAESSGVNDFDPDEAMEEDINAKWEDQIVYEFEQAQKDFGEIKTIEDIERVLEQSSILEKLYKYKTIDQDIKRNEDWFESNKDVQHLKRLKESQARPEDIEASEKMVAIARENTDKSIKEIKAREKPTEEELKMLPPELLKKAQDSNYGLGLEWELQDFLESVVTNNDPDIEFDSIRDFEDAWKQKQAEVYDGDYEGIYGEGKVFYESNGYRTTRVWVTENDTESFMQPDQYDKTSSIEDFNIEDYSGEQRTVLEFYNKQVIPYLKKFRGENLRLIEDDNGYEWWETDLTDGDKLPPTVYRVKDDMAQIGITITDAQEKEIVKLNKKFFGDESVKITEQILANNKALGSYSAKLIKILSGQANPKDTFYHEAVHKYLDVFSTLDEQVELFDAAIKKYGTDDLAVVEERLAEDFIAYAKAREGITGKIKAIFDKVIKRIQTYFRNKDVINDFYAEIITPVQEKKAVKETKKKITKTAQKKAAQTPPEIAKPIGRGKKKVSRLGLGVEAKAVEADLIEQFADLPEYNQVSTESQANRASKMVTEDFDKAVRIALGQEQPPYGLLPESVYIAVENKALEDGSVDLLRQLATSVRVSEATAMGQRIRMLAERNPDSATSKIREVVEARKKAIEESRGTTVKKETSKIKEEVDKQVKKITKGDWKSFIDSIEC